MCSDNTTGELEMQPNTKPNTELRSFFKLFRLYWIDLIKLNLLFVLCSIPIVTAPAAATAMNKIVLLMIKDKPFELKKDFFKSFKKEFFRSFFVGTVLGILLAICIYGLLTARLSADGSSFIVAAVSFFVALNCWNSAMYIFPLLAYVDLPVRVIIRNALLLLFLEIKRNIISDVIALLFILVMIVSFPFLAPLFLFCNFSYLCFTICFCIKPGLERCIIQSGDDP
jgi:uncharacterized membrane protein YesL